MLNDFVEIQLLINFMRTNLADANLHDQRKVKEWCFRLKWYQYRIDEHNIRHFSLTPPSMVLYCLKFCISHILLDQYGEIGVVKFRFRFSEESGKKPLPDDQR